MPELELEKLSMDVAVQESSRRLRQIFSAWPGGGAVGWLRSVRQGYPNLVVIDGCEIGCAKRVLEQAGVPFRSYLVITDLGIGKNEDMNLTPEEIHRFNRAVKDFNSK